MQARMKNPALVLPEAMQALLALAKASEGRGVPPATLQLVHQRVSQLNGCSVCLDLGYRKLRQTGAIDERAFTVFGWRDAPWFNGAERAALALADAVTKIADQPEGVSDEVWAEAARHYDEPALAALLTSIALVNVWNRLNVATRQVAGEWAKSSQPRSEQ
jgi:AhpD family alkylhydroperoxidase